MEQKIFQSQKQKEKNKNSNAGSQLLSFDSLGSVLIFCFFLFVFGLLKVQRKSWTSGSNTI